jgi:ribonuclease E
LRDLAGLIVIDFIDMEESRNAFQVERRVKDSMRNDRARIQIGRISPFGLLELSRQRLRPSLLEASTEPCPHCGGTGHVRSTESTALHVLRAIEEEGMHRRSAEIAVAVPTVVALYLLNRKRDALSQTERRYSFQIVIGRDDTLVPPAFRLDRVRALTPEEIAALPAPTLAPQPIEDDDDPVIDDDAEIEGETEATDASHREPLPVPTPLLFAQEVEDEEPAEAAPPKARDDEHGGRRRHRRHRGESRGRPPQEHHRAEHNFSPPRDAPAPEAEPAEIEAASAEGGGSPAAAEANGALAAPQPGGDDAGRKRRRRGRRGGRRRRREPGSEGGGADLAPGADEGDDHHDESVADANRSATELPHFDSLASFGDENDADVAQDIPAAETPPEPEHHPAAEHHADTAEHHPAAEPAPKAKAEAPAPEPEPSPPSSAEAAGPARSGWWRRR